MNHTDFNEVVRVMESVDGFMFPNNALGDVVTAWDDTFCGLDLLLTEDSTQS
ncbi:hypothetical protein NKW54_04505 [Acetobacter cerevisiae]|uniref:Uncharacterized protein n=1 Tax=Acetobacter cerevisiae TaxID=178900 RepID=A0ABT1EP90_9PROT|nr:hypothetical protein [Acetobacter cerevisiae]MCP1245198.1 hypothetical protein [Acetobacter cerevisiae]MCP1254575.1 hypothetical protein [Acetobacter cerevisiae]